MKIIEKAKKFIKKYRFWLLLILFFVLIDIANQYFVLKSFNPKNYIKLEALVFSFTYLVIYLMLCYKSPHKIRRIIVLITTIFYSVITIVNYFLISYFNTVFSWKDLVLAKDGVSFLSSVFSLITPAIILLLVILIFIIFLLFKWNPKEKYYQGWKLNIILLIILLALTVNYFFISQRLNKDNLVDGWDSTEVLSNNSNFYSKWINPNKLILIGGTYDYLVRDFYYSFIKQKNKNTMIKEVNDYLEHEELVSLSSPYPLKDKNLLFIMMESMDDWMISEEVTPTIYKMQNEGINFVNHYAPVYVTGSTANTEFIANTGLYPKPNSLSPHYAYVSNAFPNSLASLFKSEGYSVNSFHRSNGGIYNRGLMHKALGYESYNDYSEMGIDDKYMDLDSYIAINGYDKIIKDSKYMSSIITYSPHNPYIKEKIECSKNLEDIKLLKLKNITEEQLCALSSARETDNMFKILLEKLEKDNILDNTVIVAFTDHPNNVVVRKDETALLNKTPWFIYNKDLKPQVVDKITSSINILPTVLSLFGIKSNYYMAGYDALNSDESYVIFKDYTYYDGVSINPLTKELMNKFKIDIDILESNYYKK